MFNFLETAKLLKDRIKLNAEAVEENLEYRNIWFDAVINLIPEDQLEPEVEIEDNKEEEKDETPMSVNNQTPPMSPIYMPMTNDPDPEIVRYGTKGVKRNRGTRVKQTSRKSTGGKTPKRVLKEINKDKGISLTFNI